MIALEPGDIGLIDHRDFFGWLEGLYARKYKEGTQIATHGFIVKSPPIITEATGVFIKDADIKKYDGVPMWIFRNRSLTVDAWRLMATYIEATENGQGHYGFGGILAFAKSYFTGVRRFQNAAGEFCTDLTGEIIKAAGLPYLTNLNPWEVDPTTQLNWFLNGGAALGWELVYRQ